MKLEGGSARSENEISKYFAQSTAFYYNEDAFAIRTQAYDDMCTYCHTSQTSPGVARKLLKVLAEYAKHGLLHCFANNMVASSVGRA